MSAAVAILAGCAGQRVDVASTTTGSRPLIRPGRSGFVVATRDASDAGTTAIAGEIARHTGFGLVVTPLASPGAADGLPVDAYERALSEAAQGPLRFLVEIRGRDRTRCAGQLQIATVGVDPELAGRLRALAELIRDAHLRANLEIERLTVLVDSAEAAESADRTARALQIELPRCARRDWREMYSAILADFVTQAAALPAGR